MAYVGQKLTFAVQFTDDDSIAANPTTVRFWLREGVDGTELEWTYAASPVEGTDYPDGMNPIERDSTGNYHVDWVARKPERVTGFWIGSGTVEQTSQTTFFVRHSELEAIDLYGL